MSAEPSNVTPPSHASDQVAYLGQLHTTYTEHINSMMSYFLVAAGLVANASVQTFDPTFGVPEFAKIGVPLVGFATSIIFLLIHLRSSQLLHALEDEMKALETVIFGVGRGYLNNQPKALFFMRMRFLFPAAYIVFGAAFLTLMAVSVIPTLSEAT